MACVVDRPSISKYFSAIVFRSGSFVGGAFADAYEGPQGRLAMAAAWAIVLLQAFLCVLSVAGLV